MKKILLSILILIGFGTAASAQAAFSQGDFTIGIGAGLAGKLPTSVAVNFEYGAYQSGDFAFGLGLAGCTYGYDEAKAQVWGIKYKAEGNYYVSMLRLGFHYSPTKAIDIYFAPNAGITAYSFKQTAQIGGASSSTTAETEAEFAWSGNLGVRLYFGRILGIFAEGGLGTGTNACNVGLMLKF